MVYNNNMKEAYLGTVNIYKIMYDERMLTERHYQTIMQYVPIPRKPPKYHPAGNRRDTVCSKLGLFMATVTKGIRELAYGLQNRSRNMPMTHQQDVHLFLKQC